MKALVDLHRRLRDLGQQHSFAVMVSPDLGNKRRSLHLIRVEACKSINHLVNRDSFWLCDLEKDIGRWSSKTGLRVKGENPARILIDIIDESKQLKILWPDRDMVGMHAVIQRFIHLISTETAVRYLSLLSGMKSSIRFPTDAIYKYLCESNMTNHLLAPDLIRLCVALSPLISQRNPQHRIACKQLIKRGHVILHTFSTKELIIFMHVCGPLLPKCITWNEFLLFYVANHLGSSNEEDLMRLVYFTVKCVHTSHSKVQSLLKILRRLMDCSCSPTITQRTIQGHIHVARKGTLSFASTNSTPTKRLIFAALNMVVCMNVSHELQGIYYQSPEFAKYMGQYVIPLCLCTWNDADIKKKGVSKSFLVPSAEQADALCQVIAQFISEEKLLPTVGPQHTFWWRKNIKEVLDKLVGTVSTSSHRAIHMVKEELGV